VKGGSKMWGKNLKRTIVLEANSDIFSDLFKYGQSGKSMKEISPEAAELKMWRSDWMD
jgi:hypothetical protein